MSKSTRRTQHIHIDTVLIFPGYSYGTYIPPTHTHVPGYTFWKRPDARFLARARRANWCEQLRDPLLKRGGKSGEEVRSAFTGGRPAILFVRTGHLYQITTIYDGTVFVFPGLSTARVSARVACQLHSTTAHHATLSLVLPSSRARFVY